MISASYCTKIRDILIHSCLIFAFRDRFPEREKGMSGFGCSGAGEKGCRVRVFGRGKRDIGFGCLGAGERDVGFGCLGAAERGVRNGGPEREKMAGSDAPVRQLQANPGPGGERVEGGRGDEKLGPRKTIK
jgi:hypothetical protein